MQLYQKTKERLLRLRLRKNHQTFLSYGVVAMAYMVASGYTAGVAGV